MNYPVDTPLQLRAVLKGLRKRQGLTQAALGARLGLSQKRIAGLENRPQVTSFDQISRIIGLLGARLVVEERDREARPRASRQSAPW